MARRSKLREFELAEKDTGERLDVIGQGAISAGACEAEIGRVKQGLARMAKILEAEFVDPVLREDLSLRIATVEERLLGVGRDANADPLTIIDATERETFRTVFNLIYECSPNRPAAKSLVDKIIQKLAD